MPSNLISTLEPSDRTSTALPAAVVGKTVEVVAFERTASREALLFARPLHLRFDTDGTVELTMACAGDSGTYEVDGDRIAFEEFGVAALGCPALTDPNRDEAALGILLESRAQPTLTGDALRVEFAGSRCT